MTSPLNQSFINNGSIWPSLHIMSHSSERCCDWLTTMTQRPLKTWLTKLLMDPARCANPHLWIQQWTWVHVPELMLLLVNERNEKFTVKIPNWLHNCFLFKSVSFTEDRCASRRGVNFTRAIKQMSPKHINTHTRTHKYSSEKWKMRTGAQKNSTILLYQLLLHFLRLESHSEGDQAGRGGSRRGCDGRQGSRFQSVCSPAGNGDIITGLGTF